MSLRRNVTPHTCIYIYIYIYIYSHPQTDCFILSELFSVVKHVGRSKLGSKPIQLYVRLNPRQLGQQAYHGWLGKLLRYLYSNSSSRLFTFVYPIGYQSAQFFRRALHYASGGRKSLYESAQPPWGSVYIVIHTHKHTHTHTHIYIYMYYFLNYDNFHMIINFQINGIRKMTMKLSWACTYIMR